MTHTTYTHILLTFLLLYVLNPVLGHYHYDSIKVSVNEDLTAFEVFNEEPLNMNTRILCEGTYGIPDEKGDWNLLWVNARQSVLSHDLEAMNKLYFCFGFAEGALTYNEIDHFFANVYSDWFSDFASSPVPDPIYDFLNKNYQFMLKMSVAHRNRDPYWAKVSNVLSQFRGMYEGYLYSLRKGGTLFSLPLKFEDFLFLNADGDLQTLVYAHQQREIRKETTNKHQFSFESQREVRCSALIKPISVDGVLDVLVGHTTWDHFELMGPRMLKTMDFGTLEGHSFTMSSSPAMLSSIDDFFVTGSGLVVLETTNDIFNQSLFLKVVPDTLLSWVRARVANLEHTPDEWAKTFSKFNSGTYNNQWMVLAAQDVLDDLSFDYNSKSTSFVVLEQIPELIKYDYRLETLKKEGYWASYNIPFFAEIWNLSNFSMQEPADEFDHDECPRAKIFRRELVDVGEVNTIDSFKALMRFNNYTTDAYSKGNACFGISSRCDLNDVGSSTFKVSGGMDCKVVSLRSVVKGFANMHFTAQMGPTNYGLPSFNWETVEKRLDGKNIDVPTHIGQAKEYNFPWVDFPTQPPPAGAFKYSESIFTTRTVDS